MNKIYSIVLAMVFCICCTDAHSQICQEWDTKSKKTVYGRDARGEQISLELAGWRFPTQADADTYPSCGNKIFQAWGYDEYGKTNNVNHLKTFAPIHFCGSTPADIVYPSGERPKFYRLLCR
jgi:hypothetical protein